MDIARRKRLVDIIKERELGVTEQREIFNILVAAGLEYSKNNNGNFFDITSVSDEVIERIEHFVDFCFDSINILNGSSDALAPFPTNCSDGEPPGDSPCVQTSKAAVTYGVKERDASPSGAEPGDNGMQAVLQENLARARADAMNIKRKELGRFLQLRKRYSRASSKPQNYPDVLQYDK